MMIHFYREQSVIVRKRDRRRRGHARYGCNLRKQGRIDKQILPFSKTLQCGKEKELVFDEWATNRTSKLFSVVTRFWICCLFFKEVARAQRLVAKVEEARAMQLIGSRLRNHINHTAD